MHVLVTLIGIRVRWRMRILRWVKQSLCSLLVLNVGWEDGEREGAGLLEGICWCYANRVSVWLWRCAMLPAEVCHAADRPSKVLCLSSEVRHVTDRAAEMRRLSGRPVEIAPR